MRKWLNIQSRADEFLSDNCPIEGNETENGRRKSCSDGDCYVYVPKDFADAWAMDSSTNGFTLPSITPEADTLNLRTFVGTWNVGGKAPHGGLNLGDWLNSTAPADIYVIGFQEIVPLNAVYVLGPEDEGPAAKWLSLIGETLNSNKINQELPQNCMYTTEPKSPSSPTAPQQQANLKQRASFSDLLALEDERGIEDFENLLNLNLNSGEESSRSRHCKSNNQSRQRFRLAASKQMVGIFLCVWIRDDLCNHISNLKVSRVGRGILGYLGNKGSISISMTLHQSSFCFVCTHLTSGEKEGDGIRRNSDVAEILKRTRFYNSLKYLRHPLPPQTILEHDKIIWLGDLNYRLVDTTREAHELLRKNNWQPLLEKDQLSIEQKAGRVFNGWEEGRIQFAPTYKYRTNSDQYVVQTSNPKEKIRTPAWCDRILWKGEGMKQLCYARGESRFSDHRPVYSLFTVQVNSTNQHMSRIRADSCPMKVPTISSMSSAGLAKVQAEELLVMPMVPYIAA